ncbi:MAG: AAA family ATPase [Candidatus Heimdallarchaeaceae archaeon]
MKIIVLASLPLAGKTTYAKEVGSKYNIPLYETGTVVLEEVTKRGYDFTPENIKKVTDECKKISDSYFTERLIEKVDSLGDEIQAVFISGIRAVSEIEVLKNHYGEENVFTIAFHASLKTRFNRLSNPDRISETKGAKAKEDELLRNYENFMARNKKELGYGVGDVMVLADYLINTEDKLWPYSNVNRCLKIFDLIVREIIGV